MEHAHVRVARVRARPAGLSLLCISAVQSHVTRRSRFSHISHITTSCTPSAQRNRAPDQLARATTNDLELDAAIPAPATLPAHPPLSPSLYRLPPAPPCFLPSPTTVLRSTVSTFLATCIHENFLKASSWARCTIARRRSSYSGKLV